MIMKNHATQKGEKKSLFEDVKHTFYPIYFFVKHSVCLDCYELYFFADADTFLFLKLP